MGLPTIDDINEKQRLEYITARSILQELLDKNYVSHDLLQENTLDWGCGSGGSSLALREHGGLVTAVDTSQKSIRELVSSEILPVEQAVLGDGISYLRAQSDNSFDLVACFLFGPPYVLTSNPRLFSDFYTQANRVLKPEGRIIVTSDQSTFKKIAERVRNYGEIVNLEESLAGFGSTQVFVGRKQDRVYVPAMESPFDIGKFHNKNSSKGIISYLGRYKPQIPSTK
ncbi:MAG TPA: hypothetical protein DCE80_01120 [Ignavibacteriales bacterium]|nr:class I SAM-dependent methyltransferase [Candidatus Woesearchaeota archaeon]HAB50775.1 hypothetical protein [Ignavibacteriales bacterium]